MVDIYVLDTSFQTVAIVEGFSSIIWTDRFQEAGDFEIDLPASKENIEIYKPDYYLWREDSEHMMIIESTEITSDPEEGSTLNIVGRSLESILDRRVVWNVTTISGNLQSGVKKLLTENAISPTDSNRKITNLSFKDSTDSKITSLTIDAQYIGDDLLKVISDICKSKDIGFKITMPTDGRFVFELYAGVDRTYDQTDNPYIIFSPNFENLMNSNSFSSKKDYKTVALVAGSGEGSDKEYTSVAIDSRNYSDLNRRETYVEATDVQKEVDGQEIGHDEYIRQLQQKGKEALADLGITQTFDGEAESSRSFTYDVDFKMGDIVQNEDEYGQTFKSRITEYIYSIDSSEQKQYPTFTVIEKEDS